MGALAFDTYTEGLGHSTAGGGNETTYFVWQLDPALLAAGGNTIAVEIHQASATSSDTRFDLALFQQVAVEGSPIFAAGAIWKLLDDGSNLGDAAITLGAPGYDSDNWKHPDYDDTAWVSLAGDFGYDTAVVNEASILRFGPEEDNAANDPSDKYLASYFRRAASSCLRPSSIRSLRQTLVCASMMARSSTSTVSRSPVMGWRRAR